MCLHYNCLILFLTSRKSPETIITINYISFTKLKTKIISHKKYRICILYLQKDISMKLKNIKIESIHFSLPWKIRCWLCKLVSDHKRSNSFRYFIWDIFVNSVPTSGQYLHLKFTYFHGKIIILLKNYCTQKLCCSIARISIEN